MEASQEIVYTTLEKILDRLGSLEKQIRENNILSEAEGMSLHDIAALKKIDSSSLRKKPWLLPFDLPEYGRNPVIYSRRQVIEHEELIRKHGLDEVKKMWEQRVKSNCRTAV